MQLDQVTLETVKDISRAEARSMRDTLRSLVAEAVDARRRNGGTVATPAPQVEADNMVGRMTGVYLPGRTRFALAELAQQEQRSLSSMAKVLIRDGLVRRGALRTASNGPR
jgi:CopG-like RHH_1 or ribbon-helix-helix domain, RHH_5